MKCGVDLLIHSQTSTDESLKFGNGLIISPYVLLGMLLFIRTGIKIDIC